MQNVIFHMIHFFFFSYMITILTLVSTYIILYTIRLKIKHVNSGRISLFFFCKNRLICYCFGVMDQMIGWGGPVRHHFNWMQTPARVSWIFFLPHTYLCSEAFGAFPLVLSHSVSEFQSWGITPMSRTWGLVRDSASLWKKRQKNANWKT